MAKNPLGFALDEDYESPPLTDEEKAAIQRAEADFRAERYRTHEEVCNWLRQRAAEIVERARGSGRSR